MSVPTLHVEAMDGADPGALIVLNGEGVRHVRAVRLRPGALVRLTDGRGGMWRARIESVDREGVRCVLLERAAAAGVLDLELAFGVAARGRTLWLVEKAVELGVAVLQPVELARSVSVADAARSPAFWRKAERRAAAALTQSGGADLPELLPTCTLEEYLRRAEREPGDCHVTLERDAGVALLDVLGGWDGRGRIRLLVGPEGGITAEEREACGEAGFRFASLGDRTLRFETAAVAAVSAVGLIVHAGRSDASELPGADA